jgi:hypothetical protein
MYKARTVDAVELVSRLEKKLQRKAKYQAERRHAREIKHALIDFRGISFAALHEDILYYR